LRLKVYIFVLAWAFLHISTSFSHHTISKSFIYSNLVIELCLWAFVIK